jgi:phosphate transport system protein
MLMDDDLDELNSRIYDRVKEAIRKKPENLTSMMQFLTIARNLERMGDQATNICEDVIYLADGNIVRHQFSAG